MKNKIFVVSLTSLAMALAPTFAKAAEKKKAAAGGDDHAFAMKAAMGGMLEVEMGKVAAEKASSTEVKDFGKMMVTDHSKAGEELKEIAAKKNLTLPEKLDAKHQAMVDKMSKLEGTAFDQAYVPDMVEDHEKDLKEFKMEASGGKDAELKAFASETSSVIEMHLEKIKAIQTSMK